MDQVAHGFEFLIDWSHGYTGTKGTAIIDKIALNLATAQFLESAKYAPPPQTFQEYSAKK
jgi:hypothetical protein